MKYVLLTYRDLKPVDYMLVELETKDKIPFKITTDQKLFAHTDDVARIMSEIDNEKDLCCNIGDAEANTAALITREAAESISEEGIWTGGCKAFFTIDQYKELELEAFLDNCLPIPEEARCVVMCDGGDFAPLLNHNYLETDNVRKFGEALEKKGYRTSRINHIAYAVVKLNTCSELEDS